MFFNSSNAPSILLDSSDRSWVLALASAIHEADSSTSLRELAVMLTRIYMNKLDPDLTEEDLEDRVLLELGSRLESANSRCKLEDLINLYKDYDPEMEINVFGSHQEMIEAFLRPESEIFDNAYNTFDVLFQYINMSPNSTYFDLDYYLKPNNEDLDEDDVNQWQEKMMANFILGRRNAMLATLIKDCTNIQKK